MKGSSSSSGPLSRTLSGPRTCAGQTCDPVARMPVGSDVRQYSNQLVVGAPSVSPNPCNVAPSKPMSVAGSVEP